MIFYCKLCGTEHPATEQRVFNYPTAKFARPSDQYIFLIPDSLISKLNDKKEFYLACKGHFKEEDDK